LKRIFFVKDKTPATNPRHLAVLRTYSGVGATKL